MGKKKNKKILDLKVDYRSKITVAMEIRTARITALTLNEKKGTTLQMDMKQSSQTLREAVLQNLFFPKTVTRIGT